MATCIVATVAGLMRVGLLDAAPEFDELYHLLAARGWLDTGSFRILDGEYTRGSAYTRTVAWLMQITGDTSLSVARLVSLAAGVALPVAGFLWVRAQAGWGAALAVAGFMIAWPQGILEAQLLRFYSAHVLLFFVGAIAVYGAVAASGVRRWGLAGVAGLAFLAALHLQKTTIIGIGGVAIWLIVMVILSLPLSARSKLRIALGLAALSLLAIAAAAMTGMLDRAWALFRFTPDHSVELRNYVGFYHNAMRQTYESFWPLFPVAVMIGHFTHRRLTWFCVTVFATAFLAHSFGAMKANRYLSYTIPFFFTVWGVALAALVPTVLAWLGRSGLSRPGTRAVLAAVAGFVVLSNGFAISSAKLAIGSGHGGRGDWSEVRALVGDWRTAPFVATERELHMAAFFGDYDADLKRHGGWEAEFDPERVIDRDIRTGRMVVRAPDGWQSLFACKRDGLLVVGRFWWRSDQGMLFREMAEGQGFALEMREGKDILAVRWRDPSGQETNCSGMPPV